MITKESVRQYAGPALMRGPSYVYIPPHPALAPYIANYTFTCPVAGEMPDQYTIMPTASATLVYAAGSSAVVDGLRGVNTRASAVGAYANRYPLLFLIEFHPGGLRPLLGLPQSELVDTSVPLSAIDARLHGRILEALLASRGVADLKDSVDRILLSALERAEIDPTVALAQHLIRASLGGISARALSREVFYSEKHLNRLFREHIGTGIKTFARIVRVNHALRLLETEGGNMASVASLAGYFDQPHFIHDFQALCGVNPQAYLDKKSIFYNDRFKM